MEGERRPRTLGAISYTGHRMDSVRSAQDNVMRTVRLMETDVNK